MRSETTAAARMAAAEYFFAIQSLRECHTLRLWEAAENMRTGIMKADGNFDELAAALIGRGAYSYGDASALTTLKESRVREWFAERTTTKAGSIFRSDYSNQTKQQLISFLDLVDVYIAGQLRNEGISLQTLRKVYRSLQHDLGVEHPFGRHELLTDGRDVFLCGLDSTGRDEVLEVLTKQKAFPAIIRPFLKSLEFDKASRLATKWNIAKGIVVDPKICFGKPIIEAKAIPTYLVAKAVKANKNNVAAVAHWYGLTQAQVSSAINFERTRAA